MEPFRKRQDKIGIHKTNDLSLQKDKQHSLVHWKSWIATVIKKVIEIHVSEWTIHCNNYFESPKTHFSYSLEKQSLLQIIQYFYHEKSIFP